MLAGWACPWAAAGCTAGARRAHCGVLGPPGKPVVCAKLSWSLRMCARGDELMSGTPSSCLCSSLLVSVTSDERRAKKEFPFLFVCSAQGQRGGYEKDTERRKQHDETPESNPTIQRIRLDQIPRFSESASIKTVNLDKPANRPESESESLLIQANPLNQTDSGESLCLTTCERTCFSSQTRT